MSHVNQITSSIKKRPRVKRACIHCKKSKTSCSNSRPCERCTRLGLEDTCFDTPRKTTPKEDKELWEGTLRCVAALSKDAGEIILPLLDIKRSIPDKLGCGIKLLSSRWRFSDHILLECNDAFVSLCKFNFDPLMNFNCLQLFDPNHIAQCGEVLGMFERRVIESAEMSHNWMIRSSNVPFHSKVSAVYINGKISELIMVSECRGADLLSDSDDDEAASTFSDSPESHDHPVPTLEAVVNRYSNFDDTSSDDDHYSSFRINPQPIQQTFPSLNAHPFPQQPLSHPHFHPQNGAYSTPVRSLPHRPSYPIHPTSALPSSSNSLQDRDYVNYSSETFLPSYSKPQQSHNAEPALSSGHSNQQYSSSYLNTSIPSRIAIKDSQSTQRSAPSTNHFQPSLNQNPNFPISHTNLDGHVNSSQNMNNKHHPSPSMKYNIPAMVQYVKQHNRIPPSIPVNPQYTAANPPPPSHSHQVPISHLPNENEAERTNVQKASGESGRSADGKENPPLDNIDFTAPISNYDIYSLLTTSY